MSQLTPKQKQVYDAIERHIRLTGQSPTVREIGESVDLKSSCSVQKHLDTLERLRKIRRSPFKYRSIELVDANRACTHSGIPVPVLGRVAAGAPITTDPTDDPEILTLPDGLLPHIDRRAQVDACARRHYDSALLFALTVRGESMRDAGINDGDLVIARRQQVADNGDIVIAQVGSEEATVKRFYRERDAVRLQPENWPLAADTLAWTMFP
jgi:repressor LexA